MGILQRALPVCCPCSGGVHVPLSVVASDVTFTRTGGDLRSTLGCSAWMTVVIGSEWEVPPQLSAPRGHVPMSVRCEVTFNGRRDLCMMRVSHVGNWLRRGRLMGKRVWLTNESVVEWSPTRMSPERRYYLSAAGRPKRALRGRCRNSQRAAFTTGGGRTETVWSGAETPPDGSAVRASIRVVC